MCNVEYYLKDAHVRDKAFIYQTKRESIKKYVEAIWGWDEANQSKYFEDDFALITNFKVIWFDDEAVGFLETYESDELVNITEIHINPAAQGKGIGSRIINDIVRKAKECSKKVTLGCFKENDRAIRLYQRLGFRITEETETHFVMECQK